jgi:4-amino-4-deoxy-L-arabinose transferase-like glycosyltransferase
LTRRQFLLLAGLILLGYFITRMVGLLTLPLFMDEATHLTRAQAVWQGKPLDLLVTGKAFTNYLAALFYPFEGAIWIGRYVVVLIGGIGIASGIALARALYSRVAGIVAGVLWLFCPYLFFFERMALVDTSVAALATLAAYLGYRTFRDATFRDAVLCGIALAACIGAKTTGVVFLALPGAAWVLFAVDIRRRVEKNLTPVQRVPSPQTERGVIGRKAASSQLRKFLLLVVIYVTVGLLLIAPALYILRQDANVFGVGNLSSVETASLGDRLRNNPGTAWAAFSEYLHPIFWTALLLFSGVGVLFRPRRGLYLLAFAAIPLLALFATATNLYLRYLVIGLPGLLVGGAIGLVSIVQWFGWREARLLARAALAGWALIVSVPFIFTAYTNPAALPLPRADRSEYLSGWTAGIGLRDAAQDMLQRSKRAPLTVTAIIGSCNTIRLYLPLATGALRFNCPNVWEGGLREARDLVQDQVALTGTAYMIIETNGPVPDYAIPQFWQEVARYERPDKRSTVLLVRIERVSES